MSTMETTVQPSWNQLRQIPESLQKYLILRAVGLNPPDEGVSDRFVIRESIEEVIKSEQGFIYYSPHRCCYLTGDDVLKRAKLPKGTPTGDAFRHWLRSKGWMPKSERDVLASHDINMVII